MASHIHMDISHSWVLASRKRAVNIILYALLVMVVGCWCHIFCRCNHTLYSEAKCNRKDIVISMTIDINHTNSNAQYLHIVLKLFQFFTSPKLYISCKNINSNIITCIRVAYHCILANDLDDAIWSEDTHEMHFALTFVSMIWHTYVVSETKW